MWIRSQNKKDLINCKNLGIRKRLNEYVVVSISECGDFYPLGSYSSEEKALDVLDEIQELIADKQFCKIYKAEFENFVLNNCVQIYEMPQDEGDF